MPRPRYGEYDKWYVPLTYAVFNTIQYNAIQYNNILLGR